MRNPLGIGLCRLAVLVAFGPLSSCAQADEPKAPVASQPMLILRGAPLEVSAPAPLTLAPDAGVWDLSHYDSLYLKVKNPTADQIVLWARAENPEAKGVTDNCRGAVVLEPGQSQTMRLRLMRRPENPTYTPFKPFFMYFKDINVRDYTIDPAAVARVVVWLDNPKAGQKVVVESVAAQGVGVNGPVPFFPFVDKYGQYKHTDWPDKIYSDTDFAARLQKEKAEMSAYPGPPDWDKWGGWKNGPQQKATGFFYPAKVNGKWWLVDPDGALFWSYGPTGVSAGGEGTPVTDKEKWFDELPPSSGATARYWGEGENARFMYYQNKSYRSFSFSGANAERKYGKEWEKSTVDFMHRRLRNWGFNTVANWSSPEVMMGRKTPYVVAINCGGPQLEHIPDAFDPQFVKAVNERMDKERGTTAGDPWNLGYYVDNEWTWGSQANGAAVTQGALRAPATSASKQVYVGDLKAKYTDIAALNTAWGSKYASWDELLQSRQLPEPRNAAFNRDCGDFGLKFADKYFSTVRDAVKRVAPNNLYLGCRFHGHIDGGLIKVAGKYCDVISYNIYDSDPTGRLNQYRGIVDKPFIVGEFGITSDLGQMPWRGQVATEEPTVRLHNLENYLQKAFVYPSLVGAHYFQLRDQPLTGRGDGEATLRGLVNSADTPHFDLVQLNRRLAYGLYAARGASPVAAPAKTGFTYQLGEGREQWPADKRQRIVEAMDGALALYNQLGKFNKNVTAYYSPGTPTADGNFNGTIRFGGQISQRVALHELGHVLGVGTHPKWGSMVVDGKWTGPTAQAQLRVFDGPDAVLHADRMHFWPYGLNYDTESSPENQRRHVLMVAAFQRDLGIAAGVPISGMVGVGTWATQAEFKDLKVTKSGQTLWSSDFSQGLKPWKMQQGQWQVVNGALRQTSDAEGAKALIGDPTWSDYTFSLKARKLGGKEGFLIIFGSAGDDAKTWWNLGGWDNTQNKIELPNANVSPSAGQIETGRWYDIRVEVQGSTVKCYLDGQLVQQATR